MHKCSITTNVYSPDAQPASLPGKTGCGEQPNNCVLRMLVRNFLRDINDTKALIGLCLLVTSHWDKVRIARSSL